MTDTSLKDKEDFQKFAEILRKGGICIVAQDVFDAIQRFVPEFLLEFGGRVRVSDLCSSGHAFAVSKGVAEPLNFAPTAGNPHSVGQRLVSWTSALDSDSRRVSRFPDGWWNGVRIADTSFTEAEIAAIRGRTQLSERVHDV